VHVVSTPCRWPRPSRCRSPLRPVPAGLLLAFTLAITSAGVASAQDAPLAPAASESARGPAASAAGPRLPEPGVSAEASAGRGLRDWYALGGRVMHLLALCSILVVALALERCWHLRRAAVAPRVLQEAVREASASGNRAPLIGAAEPGRSSLARLLRVGLASDEPLDRVAAQGDAEAVRLRRNLPLLAAVGNLATMLGLLGTVLGMIEAFELIAAAGVGDARIVAGGIFRALVTTAAGLGVGIAALAAHALLSRQAEDRISTLEALATQLFEGKPDAWLRVSTVSEPPLAQPQGASG